MAETKHTASATNSDLEASSPSVPSDASPPEGLSRRNLMQLAASTAAIPAVAFIGAVPTEAAPVSRSAWNRAAARLRAVEAEYNRVSAAQDAAADAAEAVCPRVEEYYRRYDLGHGLSREGLYRRACMTLLIERSTGRDLTAEETEAVSADAHRIVDEFEAYGKAREEAFRDYDVWEKRHDEAADKRHEAREALINTPAPDNAAILVKLDLLATIMEGDQDSEYIEAIRTDSRRLLKVGRV